MGGSTHGESPIVGWFISWKIPSLNGWFRGTPYDSGKDAEWFRNQGWFLQPKPVDSETSWAMIRKPAEWFGNQWETSTWGFPKIGVPPVIIHFSGIFPYKPSIWEYAHLWKTPISENFGPTKIPRFHPWRTWRPPTDGRSHQQPSGQTWADSPVLVGKPTKV